MVKLKRPEKDDLQVQVVLLVVLVVLVVLVGGWSSCPQIAVCLWPSDVPLVRVSNW